MDIPLIIPSHKRHTTANTHKLIANTIYCVPDSQVDAYHYAIPGCEIVSHPDDVIGLIPKRQWILEHFPSVVMIDDDLVSVSTLYGRRNKKLHPVEAYDIIQWCGNVASLSGCYMFGFTRSPNPIYYKPHIPISMTGLVIQLMGFLEGSKLHFNPIDGCPITSTEDFYIVALNAFYHRKIFIDNRFNFYFKPPYVGDGGCAEFFRGKESLLKDMISLRKMFGDSVIYRKSYKLSPVGQHLNIPF